MSILGRGWGNDLGNMGLQNLVSPIEILTGQNFHKPKYTGIAAQRYGNVINGIDQVSASILPVIGTAINPLIGAGITGLQQGLNKGMGDKNKWDAREGWDQLSNNKDALAYQDPTTAYQDPRMGNQAVLDADRRAQEAQQAEQSGIFANGGFMYPFAMGGQLPQAEEMMEQSGPNLNTFDLPTHEQGGGQIAPNAEIHKQETVDPSAKYVFSDDLKIPGTKKTFAQESKKFKGSDKDDDITKRTNKMMLDRLRNNQEEFKQLVYEKDKAKLEKKHGPKLQQEQQAMAEQMHQQMMQQQAPQQGMPQDPSQMDPAMMAQGMQAPGDPQGMMPPGMAPQFPTGGYIGGEGSYENGVYQGGIEGGYKMLNAGVNGYYGGKDYNASGRIGFTPTPNLNLTAGATYNPYQPSANINAQYKINPNLTLRGGYDTSRGANVGFNYMKRFNNGGYYTPAEIAASGAKGKWVNIGTQYGAGDDNYGGVDKYHYGGGYAHSHFNNQQLANNNMWATGNQGPLGANSLDLVNSPIDLSGTSVLTPQDPNYGMRQPNFNMVRPGGRGRGISTLGSNDMDIEATNPNSPFFKTTGFEQPEYKRRTYESADPQAEGMTPSDTPGKFNYGKLNEMGKYAPIAYNLAQSMQPIDYYKPVYNPQYDKSIELASNMRYNADPELREARQTFSNLRGAIDQSNSLAGKLSNYQMAGIQADRAKQAILSRKQNADNGYRMQEAQIRGNLGEQRAAEDRQTQLYKLQAEAVPRNYLGTAATQYGQVSQVNTQMANQAKRDQILATAAKEQWPYDVLIKVLDQYKTA